MHLLQATPGAIDDGSEPVDLAQDPAEVVVISAADTELACLSQAKSRAGARVPSLRLANLTHLAHPLSVDRYLDATAGRARLVVVRLLGGMEYWRYGFEQLARHLPASGVALAFLPGDDKPDELLLAASTISRAHWHSLWAFLVEGGIDNASGFLEHAGHLLDGREPPPPARPLLRAGLYWREHATPSLADIARHWSDGQPVAAIVFYRALLQGAGLDPVDRLIESLKIQGLNPLPFFVASLKDPASAATVEAIFEEAAPDIVLNTTSFAVSSPGADNSGTVLDKPGRPVLQLVFAGSNEEAWRDADAGLSARDIAMNVALPEVDGRILARAVSFKSQAYLDDATQCRIATYRAVDDRIDFVSKLAANWTRLAQKSPAERRIALLLPNYPNKDGRLANGVGLDTPASTVNVLKALAQAGYALDDFPTSSTSLMDLLLAGPTNALEGRSQREGGELLPLPTYRAFLEELDPTQRTALADRWGEPEADPHVEGGGFRLALHRLGNIVIGIQPARGYQIDPQETYHSPDLVPPHNYLAHYIWLREVFGADAFVHMGKHGNLEWLPGKSLALSATCWPETVFGPVPHLYPFIVNDPGEGTQAKRRAQAVIIDHLTPPMTRAETYGPLRDLENLLDEYFEAASLDKKRSAYLKREILSLTRAGRLDEDAGIIVGDDDETALAQLDNYLCELKESQIRDGLHIFGAAPEGRQFTDLVVALARMPRDQGEAGDESLLRALAQDLGLDFDPLNCAFGESWAGTRPAELDLLDSAWRSHGDTVERLEHLAARLVEGETFPRHWQRTGLVLQTIRQSLAPCVRDCGAAEINALMGGLDGRFVAPGSSGAPTRGRLDVLPTGRNFYSVDSRAVPTPAAWHLGWKSASLLVERHLQDHGDWPRATVLTAWGTSNMRTGGDDIAQALALIGARPTWDAANRRVTGFEVIPASALGRPRVDVTLRISGFFRDAFPNLVDLFSSAVIAVAAEAEESGVNPIAARIREDAHAFEQEGLSRDIAKRRAAIRVFGSKPGAYGAGLQTLIDESIWQDRADLAEAYLEWGGYAYGGGMAGDRDRRLLERRLAACEAVIQNQDNREHDLLDSDDYYQFEGGASAAIEMLNGEAPTIYHNDHSRPERPLVKTLDEEIARVVRSRVVNPKWLEGVMRHGYKGAFEIAATVDYLFAFAATTRAVRSHHFDLVFEAVIGDAGVRTFIAENNPAALRAIAERFDEAIERQLWRPRSNSARSHLDQIREAA